MEDALFNGYIPYMKNIFDIYDKCNIYQKHAIIRGVFKQNLVWGEGELRTPLINSVFEYKVLIIKGKVLLFYEQPFRKQDKSQISTQQGDYFEHLIAFLSILAPIVDDLKNKRIIDY